MMKQHILCLAVGLLALALVVIGLRALDDTVKMPLITKGQETALPVGPDLPQEGYTAEQVQAMIAALSDPVTEADAGAVAAARVAYQALPAEQRTAVGNLTVLEQAEKTLEALRQPADQPLVVLGVGSEVTFTGGAVYGSSRAEEPARLFEGESGCCVTYYAEGTAHPFHLVSEDGAGVYGWVDATAVRIK